MLITETMNLKILIRKDNSGEPLIKIMKGFNSTAHIIIIDEWFIAWVERRCFPTMNQKVEHYDCFAIEDKAFYDCFDRTIRNFETKEFKMHLTKHLLGIKPEILL